MHIAFAFVLTAALFVVVELGTAVPPSAALTTIQSVGESIFAASLFTKFFFSVFNSAKFLDIISGSAPLSEKLFARFKARTGKSVLERYGMTETGVNTSNPINGNRIAGSVGQVLPGVKLRISSINKADGGANRIGSIEVKGENVFPEYWNLPEKTSEAFTKDGWFITGDQGYLDDDEYLYISGRSKDMIISGGLNVYPKEVEKEIEQDDLVLEAAVFGVEHSDFGEAVVAAVVTTNEKELCQETLLDTLSDKLAKYKLPKAIVTLDELPRNAMGKIQKTVLRKKYKDLFL